MFLLNLKRAQLTRLMCFVEAAKYTALATGRIGEDLGGFTDYQEIITALKLAEEFTVDPRPPRPEKPPAVVDAVG